MKRPRIDWVTNPADMIADIFWLEQDDNKKIVEDRAGRKIYPITAELKRPVSRREEQPILEETHELHHQKSPDLRIDTKLPQFKSMKEDKHYDSAASRAKNKLREAAHLHHGYNGSIRDRQFLKSKSKSDSESSDTDGVRLRRRRRGTADTHDNGRDILEKQMIEMLAKEARENEWSIPRGSIEAQILAPKKSVIGSASSSAAHSRSGSIIAKDSHTKRNSIIQSPSGRASLEVPGGNPRYSLDDLDSTAPNSPATKAAKVAGFVPTIGMDLSPPPRHISPTRSPLSKVKSRINPFHEHSRTRSRGRGDETPISMPVLSKEQTPESPDTPEGRNRSISPIKKVSAKKTDEKIGKLGRKGKTSDESSGIRGLFKGTKGGVARVSDFLWRKEPSPVLVSSGFSTDESDLEDARSQINGGRDSRHSSAGLEGNEEALVDEKMSYLSDMPSFLPTTERRGRRPQESTTTSLTDEREARDERRRASRASLLEPPPRIDIQNASPNSSPDLHATRRYSSVSDFDRRDSFPASVASADARLNAILGIPGRRRSDLPVTGLYSLETTNKRPSLDSKRHWSISDRDVSTHRGPMTKREIARVRALLLSSGIKAKEISRRGAERQNLSETSYSDIASMSPETLGPVSKASEHILAAKILSNDIHLSTDLWQASADRFMHTTVPRLQKRINNLHSTIADDLTPLARRAADEADEVSKDLVTSQTLQVKHIIDLMDKMMRRRRRKLRWLRRGGWVLVEWMLVGVMWMVWFVVTFVRVVMGVGRGL